MIGKISRYLLNELSPKLRAENCEHESNSVRESWFTRHADHIKKSVNNQQQFFYISDAKQYVVYDGMDYKSITFDQILSDVRDCVARDIANSVSTPTTGLVEWKQNVGYEVLEEIQNVPLHETIPNSSTIQTTIASIYPSVFETRDEAKYFLTVLGDSLMGKFPKMVYLTNSVVKPFITMLQRDISLIMGIQNCLSGVKYKYHDHVYADCRVMNVSLRTDVSLPHIQSRLNMFAVALHYSVRHNSGDEFATRYLCCGTTERIFYLRDNMPNDIVDKFMHDMIQDVDPESGSHITQKEMLFLWKNFLELKKLPNVMFSSTFLDIIGGTNSGSSSDTNFPNKISKFLPGVSSFNSFWDECIVNSENDADEMEMDELTFLYRQFLSKTKRSFTLDADGIGRIMRHFHPTISISYDKYVTGIRHKDWDKNKQVMDMLQDIRMSLTNETSHAIPLNVLYKQYTGRVVDGSMIVSKRFFETVVTRVLSAHVDNQSVSCTWWNEHKTTHPCRKN
jgi:hypothetical protein